MKRMLGSHIGMDATLTRTITNAIEAGLNSVQFFLGSPQSFSRKRVTEDDIKEAVSLLSEGFSVVSHYPYIANLAGSKEILAWSGNTEQDKKTMNVIRELSYELSVLSKFPRNGVVIHPGNHIDKEKGLKAISESINKITFTENAMLLLENTAGGGTSLCGTLHELKTVIDSVNKKEHVGVCIDTCHLFAYGDYDLRDVKEIKRFFRDFHKIIGIEKFRLLHLNDSCEKHKSRKDRHANILTGEIWKDNVLPLLHILRKCKKYNIAVVLETTDIDVPVLKRLLS